MIPISDPPTPFTVLCPREPFSNGMVTYSTSDDPPLVGAVATYSCDTGYELSGASTRIVWLSVDGVHLYLFAIVS